jgi:serine/threonine protein kinase
MSLSAGDTLGPYQVLSPLGSGGMGEVWKARDTRLDRVVAIKTSRTEFSDRFAAEARAVAALNHPNICQLYDLGKLPDGGGYLVMEYVDGAPIAPVDSPRKLLDLTIQIADGLAAAHAAGFTHRDLKPENVLVTGSQSPHPGRVKILDFGLVKQAASTSDASETTAALTNPGTVLGTVAYMSPEQARGQDVDARSDQFSFGLLVHELAAGRRTFARPTAAETMAAIIRDDAEPLPSSVPLPLRWIIERCLAKDPAERYDSTRDLYRELKQTRDRLSEISGPQAAAPVSHARPSRGLAWGAAALAGVAIAAITFGLTRFLTQPADPPAWSGVMLGGPETALNPRVSPDGHLLSVEAMVDGITQIAVMKPESGNWSVLTRDRSHGPMTNHCWSPDGALVYYDRFTDAPQGIYSVPVLGGDERLVLENAFAPEAVADGTLLVVRQNGDHRFQLHRFWPGTGRVQALPLLTAQSFYWSRMRALPDGTGAVVWGEPLDQKSSLGFYLIDLATGTTTRLDSYGVEAADGATNFAITPDGGSVLATRHAGALTNIFRFPVRGPSSATTLLTVSSAIWFMDAGPDGSIYAGMVDRPVDVIQFAPDGTGVKRLASFPQIPDLTTMAVLPDGRAVLPVRASSRVRLMAVQKGKDPSPLLATDEETAAPVAACGPREVALMVGAEPRETIGFAEPSTGRLVRTVAPGKGSVDSISCSPDGATVYFSARGIVWSMPSSGLPAGTEPRKIRAGDSVVADPSGRRLIVQAQDGARLRRLSVPLDGGPESEIPTDASVPVAPMQLSPNALRADGRLLTSLLPPDSWFNPPAIVDTRNGGLTRIAADNASDYQSVGWSPSGDVVALNIRVRAAIWKFQREPH